MNGPDSSSASDVDAWLPSLGNDCRGLLIKYNGSGRITELDRIGYLPHTGADGLPGSGAGMGSTQVASYTYATDGTLSAACDLRQGASFCTTYTYVSVDGRTLLASETPPGQASWTFHYDDHARLTSVTRPLAADSTGSGPATWTMEYGVSPTASGLPDLTANAAAAWGQDSIPTAVSAVFGPNHVPAAQPGAADWPYAQLWYSAPDGATTNSAQYGDGQWLIDTTWYDDNGNITQSLSAAGRAQALAAPADQQAEVAADESSFTQWSNDGSRVSDEYGPTVDHVQLADGSGGPYRSHTHYVYDDDAPDLAIGRPALPEGQTSFNLVVEEDHSAADADMGADHDLKVMRYRYDPVVSGDGSGWLLGEATQAEVELPDGSWSTTTTRFDAQGHVIQTIKPGGARDSSGAGTDAHATDTEYYSADASAADPQCQSHPEWAGLTCRTGPASQPGGSSVPTTWVKSYSADLAPTRVEDVSGSTTRSTITQYDEAGRVTSRDVDVRKDGAETGPTLPATTYEYDDQGNQDTQAAGGRTTSTSYDTWGRPRTYTDALGTAASSTYTSDGLTATYNDGSGVYQYTYDSPSEHRRLATSVDVGVSGNLSTFTLGYDERADVAQVTYPNGTLASRTYNDAGDLVGLDYSQAGQSFLAFSAAYDAFGQTSQATSPESTQDYGYDGLGRLTSVQDDRANGCTTRTYAFNASSDRTSTATYGPAADGSCQTAAPSTSTTRAYDSADRIISAGYTYDDLGRAISVPATDTAPGGVGALSASFYPNDMVASLTQQVSDGSGGSETNTDSYSLDPTGRVESISEDTNGQATGLLRYLYADESDSPRAIQSSDDGGVTWSSTRYIEVPGIGMTGSASNGALQLQLCNLHGDIVATQADTAGNSAIDTYTETDEYGVAIDAATSRYNYLGSQQRSTDSVGGLTLMGARLYNPVTGQFLSPDPVAGGGATPYAYPTDPVDMTDITGQMWGWVWDAAWWVTGEILGSVCAGAAVAFFLCRAAIHGVLGGLKYITYHMYVKHTRWSWNVAVAVGITSAAMSLPGSALAHRFEVRAIKAFMWKFAGILARRFYRIGWYSAANVVYRFAYLFNVGI